MTKRHQALGALLQLLLALTCFAGRCASAVTTPAPMIFERCTSNSQCTPPNSWCEIISPTCGGGTCMCLPGFETDQYRFWCKSAIQVNKTCYGQLSNCHDSNAECRDSRCQCVPGYKIAVYKNPDCVLNVKTSGYGETCTSTDQCYNELICNSTSKTCVCPPGYRLKKEQDNYHCTPRLFGESCEANDDCSQIPYSTCNAGHCACQSSAKAQLVSIMTSPVEADVPTFAPSYMCYTNTHPSGETELCNIYSQLGNLTYCKYPFVCRFCSYKFMCVRPQFQMILNGVSSPNRGLLDAMLIFIVALFLIAAWDINI